MISQWVYNEDYAMYIDVTFNCNFYLIIIMVDGDSWG